MMKKITAVILALAMLLCAAFAAAESAETGKVAIGTISINGAFTLQCAMPEGYSIYPVKATQDQIISIIRSQDPAAPLMTLSVAFDETYSDVDRMNDLDQDALTLLEHTFIEDDPGVDITYAETGYGTLLLIAKHDTESLDFISFLSLYKGYFVEFVLYPSNEAEDKNLTDEQVRKSIDFLTELDFIPAVVPVGGGQPSVAGGRYITNLTDYDEETNTVRASVKRPIVLRAEEVEALKEGDTLAIGHEQTAISTIVRDEDGSVVINDEIYLRPSGEGYHAFYYEYEYLEVFASLALEVPENLVFLDEVDPDSGEMLETATEHTAAEFIKMLSEGRSPDFASDNVYVTYDEKGAMSLVERIYTPWQ